MVAMTVVIVVMVIPHLSFVLYVVFCVDSIYAGQREKSGRTTELTVVHESLLEEEAGDEGEALLMDSEKVKRAWGGAYALFACRSC